MGGQSRVDSASNEQKLAGAKIPRFSTSLILTNISRRNWVSWESQSPRTFLIGDHRWKRGETMEMPRAFCREQWGRIVEISVTIFPYLCCFYRIFIRFPVWLAFTITAVIVNCPLKQSISERNYPLAIYHFVRSLDPTSCVSALQRLYAERNDSDSAMSHGDSDNDYDTDQRLAGMAVLEWVKLVNF